MHIIQQQQSQMLFAKLNKLLFSELFARWHTWVNIKFTAPNILEVKVGDYYNGALINVSGAKKYWISFYGYS